MCPQTSHTATFCIRQPMAALYIMPSGQNALDFESASVYTMSYGQYANRTYRMECHPSLGAPLGGWPR
jgi:hypothetical protein